MQHKIHPEKKIITPSTKTNLNALATLTHSHAAQNLLVESPDGSGLNAIDLNMI